jgi:primase-polymerase (primpol)-like protein
MTLIPAEFKDEKKFIVYTLTPSTDRPGKLDKKPCWDWSDPSKWLCAEDAERQAAQMGAGHGLGYVLTEDSGRLFFDSDGCRNRQTGELTKTAWDAMALFIGAYVEVSVSMTGIHILGKYRGGRPAHGCKNIPLGLELYTGGRWVAMGTPYENTGSVDFDCTEAMGVLIASYFPATGDSGPAQEWSDSPVAEWRGLTDDRALIEKAMGSNSASAAFGDKATFADLWSADAAKLGRAYPADGRLYDASSADLALAQHLAFFTGNDCERIRRLMLLSSLVRDKWERADYLQRTILKAVGRQDAVYGESVHVDAEAAKRRQEQIAENLSIGEGTEEYPVSRVLTEDEMLTRYVNIIEGKRVVDLEYPRRIFALDEWKSAHKSSRTVLEDKKNFNLDGSNKTKSVETAKLWEMNPARRQVDAVTFRPGYKPVTEDPEGKSAANTWRAIKRTGTAGDASLFLRHIEYLFSVDAPRFLDWLAHIEQRPGELPHTGWVHISPMQGTGRNWLASVLCRLWSGYVAASFDLAGTLRTGFNGPLSQKLLAVVDEINEGGTDGRWENAETLKSLITSEHRHINPKYGHQRLEYNACRWLIFSNHTSALPLTERDRRFNIVRNENPPMPPQYYVQLYATLKEPGFIASVAELLRTRDIATFNPGAHALMNEAKREMVAASRSDADDLVAHLVADHPADVIANSTLGALLTNQIAGKLTPHHKHALERAGVRPYGKAIRLGSVVSKVSILRNHSIWMEAAPYQIQTEIAKAPIRPPFFGDWPINASVN